jgi:hypothetical protein
MDSTKNKHSQDDTPTSGETEGGVYLAGCPSMV